MAKSYRAEVNRWLAFYVSSVRKDKEDEEDDKEMMQVETLDNLVEAFLAKYPTAKDAMTSAKRTIGWSSATPAGETASSETVMNKCSVEVACVQFLYDHLEEHIMYFEPNS